VEKSMRCHFEARCVPGNPALGVPTLEQTG